MHAPHGLHRTLNFIIMSDIAGAIGSVANGILGFFGQKSANKANKQMTQMNIDANKEMQQTANDFTERMWNQNNEYNSPLAQRMRLQEAGINPLSQQMGNQAAQQVSGASGSAGSPIAMQNELGQLGLGIQNAVSQIYDNRLKKAEAAKAEEDARSQHIENEKNSYELDAMNKPFAFTEDAEGKLIPITDQFGNESIGEALKYKKLRIDYRLLEEDLKKATTENKKLSHEEKIADIESRTKELSINSQNALNDALANQANAGARLSDQKVKESKQTIKNLEKECELLDKKITLSEDEHDLNEIAKDLAEYEKKVYQATNKLLTDGWSTEAVGNLLKIFLINFVQNITGVVGGSVSKGYSTVSKK